MSSKDYISVISNAERRFVSAPVGVEKRTDGEAEQPFKTIEGYAALFDSRTDLGYVYEEIAPGAFDDVLGDDVRCLFNHDANQILARSANGTLSLWVDEKGLKYKYATPDRSYAKDLQDAIESGDVSESSFAFEALVSQWIHLEDEDKYVRRITKMKRLFDVSPVTYPAYKDTSVAKRSLASYQKQAAQSHALTKDKRKCLDVFEAQFIVNKNFK